VTGYDAILFDNDGVLIHPPAYETQAAATRDAFAAVGAEAIEREHVDDIVSGVTVDRLHEICAAYDLEVDAFWEAREHHDERAQFDEFRAGERTCYDDVDALADLAHACGVVSNNHHSTVEFVLEYFELASHFDVHYGREKTVESLRRKKPNAHYLDRALEDLDAESALYVGDSESDVVAAHSAGLDSAFVRREHCRDVELAVTPTYEVETLHEVTEIATREGAVDDAA
jgi:HAD superfamily hydrolase (TIGR01549 family)